MEAGLSDYVWSVEEICNLLAPEKAMSGTKANENAMILKTLKAPKVKEGAL